MVEVRNSTPEPDGSRKTYFLRVPPTVRTAREAVAWTFGLGAVEYRPLPSRRGNAIGSFQFGTATVPPIKSARETRLDDGAATGGVRRATTVPRPGAIGDRR